MRRKIVETGDVDVMISIRSNFFYTRTVPCELWHLRQRQAGGAPRPGADDRCAERLPESHAQDLRLLARSNSQNLTAIVWLYRGQRDRFLGLVKDYVAAVCRECAAVPPVLATFEATLAEVAGEAAGLVKNVTVTEAIPTEAIQPLTDILTELDEERSAYETDRAVLSRDMAGFRTASPKRFPPTTTPSTPPATSFDPLAERVKGLIKQVDLLYKHAARGVQLAGELAALDKASASGVYERRAAAKRLKRLEEERKAAVDQLRNSAYGHRQIVWLQDRFPTAEMRRRSRPVQGRDRCRHRRRRLEPFTPAATSASLRPEVDEDFDFEEKMREIHVELADLTARCFIPGSSENPKILREMMRKLSVTLSQMCSTCWERHSARSQVQLRRSRCKWRNIGCGSRFCASVPRAARLGSVAGSRPARNGA